MEEKQADDVLNGAFICNRADGVDGHYCIGRHSVEHGPPWIEFYDKGEWKSAGQLFFGFPPLPSPPKEG